jgi:arylsulfatase A-like enzyme
MSTVRCLIALVFFVCTLGGVAAPNVVLFLVDDMGWQDTSVPFHSERTLFNDHFRTPNMERLAKTGCKFTQAYAASVCSPTRTSIMTGQSPLRHKVTNWTLNKDGETSGKSKRLKAPKGWNRNGLQPDAVTLPDLLQAAGYYTIHAGKAHWGAYDTPGSDPLNLGFDVNIAGHAAGGPGGWYGKTNFGNHPDGRHKRPWGIPGLQKYHGKDVHLTDVTTIESLAAVETAVKKKQPFYLYLAHYTVHAPIRPHPPYDKNYNGKTFPGTDVAISGPEAAYASMVEGMDASLGQVLEKLEALGVAEDTIVLFSSDNGGLSAHARGTTPYGKGKNEHCRPLREGKGSVYEGGTRVPMLVSWAKVNAANANQQAIPITSGSTTDVPNICEDYYPTIIRWAGIADKLKDRTDIDGRDFTAALAAESKQAADRAFHFHYPHVWGPRGPGYQPHSSIRIGDWKAVYLYEPKKWELYNLKDDLGEGKNLAASHPERLKELTAKMRAEHKRLGAQYPALREGGEAEAPAWP